MGLAASTKNAIRISLGHSAANEVISLLDRLSDEIGAEKARKLEVNLAASVETPQVITPADPVPGPVA